MEFRVYSCRAVHRLPTIPSLERRIAYVHDSQRPRYPFQVVPSRKLCFIVEMSQRKDLLHSLAIIQEDPQTKKE